MENLIKIGNHYYDLNREHFSPELDDSINYVTELFKLQQFPNLKSASFADKDLNDEGLAILSNITQLEFLNLQGTEITNEGLKHLKKLKNLKILRLKENPQLTNECVPYITEIENLEDLQIHETSINQEGLEKLTVLKKLEGICIQDDDFKYKKLLKFSKKMPNCFILAKGSGEFHNGEFTGEWKR